GTRGGAAALALGGRLFRLFQIPDVVSGWLGRMRVLAPAAARDRRRARAHRQSGAQSSARVEHVELRRRPRRRVRGEIAMSTTSVAVTEPRVARAATGRAGRFLLLSSSLLTERMFL